MLCWGIYKVTWDNRGRKEWLCLQGKWRGTQLRFHKRSEIWGRPQEEWTPYFFGILLWTQQVILLFFSVFINWPRVYTVSHVFQRHVEQNLSPKHGIFGRGEVRAGVRWVRKNKVKNKIQEDCILKMERKRRETVAHAVLSLPFAILDVEEAIKTSEWENEILWIVMILSCLHQSIWYVINTMFYTWGENYPSIKAQKIAYYMKHITYITLLHSITYYISM